MSDIPSTTDLLRITVTGNRVCEVEKELISFSRDELMQMAQAASNLTGRSMGELMGMVLGCMRNRAILNDGMSSRQARKLILDMINATFDAMEQQYTTPEEFLEKRAANS